jgi:hypothetical protein
VIPSKNLSEYLCEIATGKNRLWSKQSGRERNREREHQINGVRDGTLDRYGNGLGWRWLIVKMTPEYFS